MIENTLRFIRYLGFKMDCLREQESNPLTLDVELCEKYLAELEHKKEEKVEALKKAMPKNPITKKKEKPKVLYKKDGSLSSHGMKWFETLRELKLPEDTCGPVTYVDDYEDGNPNSTDQVKSWLFSLGWKPRTFKYVRNKDTGEERRIEQVRKDGHLCQSVRELTSKDSAIELLDGLTVLSHRIGVLKGFLNNQVDGKVVSSAGGFTNTLRLQHRAPVVNLPGVEAEYGEWCRGVLIPEEGKIMVGADVVSLEDTLKQHFIYPHDPEYVEEMNADGFDPHLSLGIEAGKVTEDDYQFYINCEDENDERFKSIKSIRKPMKTTNYACQYNVGAKTLARNSGMTEREAGQLIDAYWKKNWAIKRVAKGQYVKTLKDGTMWLKNPINGFYYNLRYDKDRFSTLVQGSGDYVFNLWALFCRKTGIQLHLNYHDEWLTSVPDGQQDLVYEKAQDAMDKVNETLKLNKEIKMDAQGGYSYAECH